MADQYPYAPPPPPPSSTANGYPYAQAYQTMPPRGGHVDNGAGRGRGQLQGPNRSDYGSPFTGYPASQDYNTPHSAASYVQQPPSNYWNGAPVSQQPQGGPPLPQANYHPNYAPQGFQPPPQTTYPTSVYPANNQRPPFPPYNSPGISYPSTPSWNDTSSPHSPYSNRGGSSRGGFSGDRGVHRSDHTSGQVMRMGFDQHNAHGTQASNGYGPSVYHAPQHSSSASFQQSPYYPPVPPPHAATSHSPYSSNRGRGRDGFSGSRGRSGHNERGDKFRNRGQRPHHDHAPAQKSDHLSAKKKKRKINTLGLTPGDDDESDDASGDEEKRLTETLAADLPVIADLAKYIAERKANYPTKARIAAKRAAEQAKHTEVGENQKPAAKPDKDEEKAQKLRRQLAKVERKLEKRKREQNDEGDDMRVDGDESSSSSSEDEKPESLSTRKPSFLPPPPISRADPSNHCKYYATGGTCGKKTKCRFKHDPQVREKALLEQAMNGGRMTLKQRLLRNDKDSEDLAVIQSIVNLKATGKLLDSKVNSGNGVSATLTHPLPANPQSVPKQITRPTASIYTDDEKLKKMTQRNLYNTLQLFGRPKSGNSKYSRHSSRPQVASAHTSNSLYEWRSDYPGLSWPSGHHSRD